MVNQQLLMPQEIEVLYIIPTIRKHLSVAMKEAQIPQKDIAVRLGVRESTVSQYLNEKRATQVEFPEEILTLIRVSATKIKNTSHLVQEMQIILTEVRKTNVLCKIHREISNLPDTCALHTMGCV